MTEQYQPLGFAGENLTENTAQNYSADKLCYTYHSLSYQIVACNTRGLTKAAYFIDDICFSEATTSTCLKTFLFHFSSKDKHCWKIIQNMKD